MSVQRTEDGTYIIGKAFRLLSLLDSPPGPQMCGVLTANPQRVLKMRQVTSKKELARSKMGAERLNQDAINGIRRWEWRPEVLQELVDEPGDYIEFSYRMRSTDS